MTGGPTAILDTAITGATADGVISPGEYVAAVFATFLVALTIAPVPSASVVTLPPALGAVGVPIDGIGILLGIDRIPDMFRTVVNVSGDVAAAAVVAFYLSADAAGLYRPWRGAPISRELTRTAACWLVVVPLTVLFSYVVGSVDPARRFG